MGLPDLMATWLQMPIADHPDSSTPVSPRYTTSADSVVVYCEDNAYVGIVDAGEVAVLTSHEDVRVLSAAELRDLEQHIPLRISDLEHHIARNQGRSSNRPLRLGDLVAALTRHFGKRRVNLVAADSIR